MNSVYVDVSMMACGWRPDDTCGSFLLVQNEF